MNVTPSPLPFANTGSNLLLAPDSRRSILTERSSGQGRQIAYCPYGSTSARRPARARTGFNGQLHEPLGWYCLGNGHRVYNPVLRRFHSPDRLSPFARGGLNAYAYCLGDPVNHVDPTGRAANFMQVATLIGIGFGVLAGASSLLGPFLLQRAITSSVAQAIVASGRSSVAIATNPGIVAGYVATKPPVAGAALGGLDALASIVGLLSLPLAGANTVENINDPMTMTWELGQAAAALALFVMPVKLAVPYVPTLPSTKWGKRVARLFHGREKVLAARSQEAMAKTQLVDDGIPMVNLASPAVPSSSASTSQVVPHFPPMEMRRRANHTPGQLLKRTKHPRTILSGFEMNLSRFEMYL